MASPFPASPTPASPTPASPAPPGLVPVGRAARTRRAFVVAAVVARHGYAHLRDLARPGPLDRAPRARRARLLAQDLGATAIKIGQILSTRPDVLAPEYTAELAMLQDAAPPEDPGAIDAVITAELGGAPDRLFAAWDPRPLAAASIGQAHAALHPDGTAVVVKVRRPGVVELVATDLDILDGAAAAVERCSRRARQYHLRALTRQFATTLGAELDYRLEAANAERFAAAFADRPEVRIPRVFHDRSTSRVITLERMVGTKPDDLGALAAAGVDLRALAARCADVMLTMVFELGFFHADPHAGNFFVADDGTIGLVDFGMVGEIVPSTRHALARALVAVATGRTDQLGDAALALGLATGPIERDALLADLDRLVRDHLGRPLGDWRIGEVLGEIMSVMRRHRLRLPVDLALLAKTFAMSEGLAARLDPGFRMADAVLAHSQRLLTRDC